MIRPPVGVTRKDIDRVAEMQGELIHVDITAQPTLEGSTNARIGVKLGIAERTVEVHISAILDRAQCRSRAELSAAVLRMS